MTCDIWISYMAYDMFFLCVACLALPCHSMSKARLLTLQHGCSWVDHLGSMVQNFCCNNQEQLINHFFPVAESHSWSGISASLKLSHDQLELPWSGLASNTRMKLFSNVGNPTINLPFGNGLYHPFTVIFIGSG